MVTQEEIAHIHEVIGLIVGSASGRKKIIQELWHGSIPDQLEPITSHGPRLLPQENWLYAFAGTRAARTCIAAGESLTLSQSDYFEAANIPLTCVGGSIFDSNGNMPAQKNIRRLTGGTR